MEAFRDLEAEAAKATRRKQAEAGIQTPAQLLELLGITEWEYLLVGDGSGNRWISPGGWATALIQRQPAHVQWFYGGVSNATNIVCEMMAYVQPLLWLLAQHKIVEQQRVHIITDCEHLVDQWPRPGQWKANRQLWRLFRDVNSAGYTLNFHWIPRDTVSFNKMADELAGLARLTAVALGEEAHRIEKKYFPPPEPAKVDPDAVPPPLVSGAVHPPSDSAEQDPT